MAAGGDAGAEWISVSDLMAGVVAVMVMLFAMAALENSLRAREAVEQAEAVRAAKADATRAREAERRRSIDAAFAGIRDDVEALGLGQLVEVDESDHHIRLRDATFAVGSACVAEQARAALGAWAARLRQLLEERAQSEIFVEGHTDSRIVASHSSNIKEHCARFDDNYTLSAARARQARAVLVAEWPQALQQRVALAGFGDSRPLDPKAPASSVNRRVEIYVREPTPVGAAVQGGMP